MATKNGRISLSMYDSTGAQSTWLSHVAVDDTLTIANANAAIATVAALVGTVSDAGIKDGTFTLINRAVAAAPAGDADVGSGGVFDFSNAHDPTTYGQWVPSIKDALKGPTKTLDIVTAGALLDYVNALTGAILGGTYDNPAFQPNLAALRAFLTNRKRRGR